MIVAMAIHGNGYGDSYGYDVFLDDVIYNRRCYFLLVILFLYIFNRYVGFHDVVLVMCF